MNLEGFTQLCPNISFEPIQHLPCHPGLCSEQFAGQHSKFCVIMTQRAAVRPTTKEFHKEFNLWFSFKNTISFGTWKKQGGYIRQPTSNIQQGTLQLLKERAVPTLTWNKSQLLTALPCWIKSLHAFLTHQPLPSPLREYKHAAPQFWQLGIYLFSSNHHLSSKDKTIYTKLHVLQIS